MITHLHDAANQLIRENNPYENRTWVWTYDDAGNILYEKEYAYTLASNPSNPVNTNTYGYTNSDTGWWDLLRSYNGRVITYDEIGNPLSDGVWDYTWQQGRQLASMTNGSKTWTYTYDANGMRLSRSTGTGEDDVTYTYVYTDGLLTRMTKGDVMLYFTYDAAGTPMTVSIHTGSNCAIGSETGCGADCTTYYYVTNLQGDVIAILDDSGTAITLYQYDAWGYPTLTLDVSDDEIGMLNPLLYRGYVYDRETGLYYLQSRYYNPEIGRFISADAYVSTGQGILGNNMFAYCTNNPVNYLDASGHSADSVWKKVLGITAVAALATVAVVATVATGGSLALLGVSALVGATTSFLSQGLTNVKDGENFFHDMSVSSIIMGAVAGAAFATGIGGFWGAVAIGSVSTAGAAALEQKSWGYIAGSFVVGGIAAATGYGAGQLVSKYLPQNMDLGFNEYFNLGKMDMGVVGSACHAFMASWYTFLPTFTTATSRAAMKTIGNMGIGWAE